MKRFFILFLMFLVSCNVSERLLKQGDYHNAVITAVNKLQRNPQNEKQKDILKKAYPLAVQQDLQKIDDLNKEGQPDRWEEIYLTYKRLKERQDLVKTIEPTTGLKFEHKDFSTPMFKAKRKAAAYFYAHAKKLMSQNNKFAYRQAFFELQKAKQYDPSLPDIDKLLQECYDKGTTYVILTVKNSTFYKLSDEFLANLINFPLTNLNSQWIEYYNTDARKGNYDITIVVNINYIDVSPDNLDEKSKIYKTKKVVGYEYKLDENGNVVKDSLGNPVKVPKYKIFTCELKTYRQFKIAHIEGTIDYIDNATKQMIHQLPIAADHVFENYYYVANGYLNALPDEVRKKLNSKPLPYPHPLDMIYAANETLKQVIYDALMENKGFLEMNY